MNRFKVGDTVWTVKRGKGKIIGSTISNRLNERPFSVRFEGESSVYIHYPKLSNIYRTEAEMIEAKRIKNTVPAPPFCIIDVSLPKPPQPKFKQGDKVYYEGKKWTVLGDAPYTLNRYSIKRGDNHITLTYATESDLRLWKEHEFTHYLEVYSDKWNVIPIGREQLGEKTEYLGRINGHETFLITGATGIKYLVRGKKGDIEI